MTLPHLRADLVQVERRDRDQLTYIIKDPQSHKYFRFRPLEMAVLRAFDGRRTSAEIAASLAEQGLAVSAAAVAGFARKVGEMGLLLRSVAERSVLLMERLRAERRRRVAGAPYAGSLLRMRFSLVDPDAFFDRWTPRLGFFFSRPFLLMSVCLFAVYVVITVAKRGELVAAFAGLTHPGSYTLAGFVTLYVTALVIIFVHEMGHGFTCKYFGGQVNEMGFMLIYFQPAFYCNVNDAWTFPDLGARLWVTAAGSWIQLVLAAIGAIVWWAAAPGTLMHEIGLDAVLIGGVMTVLANANPLIPLDGYYALSDYLEIPNLRQRALRYMSWLLKRKVLRLELPEPPGDDRERRVFRVYGTLAVAYSAALLFLFIASLFGWVSRTLGTLGVLALGLLVWSMMRGSIREWSQAVVTSVREHRAGWRSRRLWMRLGGVALGAVVLGLVVPWHINVNGAFTAAPPLAVALTAPMNSVVSQVYATEGARIPAGAPVIALRNLGLEREALETQRLIDSMAVLEAEARARGNATGARRFATERDGFQAQGLGIRTRLEALILRAPVSSVVLTPRLEETLGRRFESGKVVVRLGETDSAELRVRLERSGAPLVRPGQQAALFSYAEPGAPIHGTVRSVAASGTGGPENAVEARVSVANVSGAFRPGVTGEARIVVGRSNVLGALWWGVRKRIRTDLLL